MGAPHTTVNDGKSACAALNGIESAHISRCAFCGAPFCAGPPRQTCGTRYLSSLCSFSISMFVTPPPTDDYALGSSTNTHAPTHSKPAERVSSPWGAHEARVVFVPEMHTIVRQNIITRGGPLGTNLIHTCARLLRVCFANSRRRRPIVRRRLSAKRRRGAAPTCRSDAGAISKPGACRRCAQKNARGFGGAEKPHAFCQNTNKKPKCAFTPVPLPLSVILMRVRASSGRFLGGCGWVGLPLPTHTP